MAYNTYTTEAIVCGTWSRNTSDKSYLLFTRDAGMVYGDARSVRMEKSKQRYALQDFSHIRVSLIKGKGGWRIGSVESIDNFYLQAVDKAARGSVVTILRWLRRFYKGEEAAPHIFDFVKQALAVLVKTSENRNFIERGVQLKILTELGYVDKKWLPPAWQETDDIMTLTPTPALEKLFDTLTTKAITSSQL